MYLLVIIMYSLFLCMVSLFMYYYLRRQDGGKLPFPPGPKAWPIIGNLPHMGPMPHRTLATMARTYGPLLGLRLGLADVVVAASAGVAEQLLKVHDAKFLSRPRNAGGKYLAYNYHDLVYASYGPRWRLLRKVTALHLFSAKALNDYRHVRQEEVAALTNKLASLGTTPVIVGHLLNVCTANTLGRVMMGRRVFGDGDDPKADEFKLLVVESMVWSGMFNIGDVIPALEWLDLQGIVGNLKKLHKRLNLFLSDVVEEHKRLAQSDNENRDMLSSLISMKRDEGKITETEIKGVLMNMFLAGTDTSSSAVEWALAELIHHPKILAKVQQELDSFVGKHRLVSEEDLPKLTYLKAVIKETFRLHPSTPLAIPRMATESCEVNGYHIPKGATLLVNIWAIGRDPKQWTEPEEFKPERFLAGGERPNADVTGNDFEIIPFGSGRRICAGMSLGLRMVQLATATMVHAFDWELPDGLTPEQLNMEEVFGLTLQRKVPLTVYPKPRLSKKAYK